MRMFVKIAIRLSIVFEWCTKLLKQFVTLTRWVAIASVAVASLVAVVKALLSCSFTRRQTSFVGGV